MTSYDDQIRIAEDNVAKAEAAFWAQGDRVPLGETQAERDAAQVEQDRLLDVWLAADDELARLVDLAR